jgi:hypothetical protein
MITQRARDRRRLLALLGASAAASLPARCLAAQEDPARDALLSELDLRNQEALLLHRRVDVSGTRLLKNNQLIDVAPPIGTSRLLVLHIWAVECRPCIDELPNLRRIAEGLPRLGSVKLIMVCETADRLSIQRYLTENAANIPRVEQYLTLDGRLRASLENRSQPTTLLLDPLGSVRQAFLGSLNRRRAEFVDAIQRLMRNL